MKIAITAAMLAATAACTTASPAASTPPPPDAEMEAILKVVDTFLLAIGNGDTALQASVELPDGMLAYSRLKDGVFQPVKRIRSDTLQKPAAEHDPFIEWYWSPKVDIRGPIAQFWAPYELRDNGAVVHCGIDAFQLVKIDGAWKIHSTLSTMEPGVCADMGANDAPRRPRDGWKETPNQ